MKRLLNVLIVLLAVNFLAAAGAIFWLFNTGRLDHGKIVAIKEIVFPPAAIPKPAAPPSAATTQPLLKLDELLAQRAGLPPAEQLQYIRESFDTQMAYLDRKERSVQDLQRQVLAGQKKLADDRAAFEIEKKKLAARETDINKLANDKGFQDSLAMYQALPPKTVKNVFMGLEDDTVIQYLQAMESQQAAKIMKEFKTQPEVEHLKKLMERMRQSQASAKE